MREAGVPQGYHMRMLQKMAGGTAPEKMNFAPVLELSIKAT